MIGQIPPYCVHCKDFRVVSTTDFHRKGDLVPCPYCGDPLRRERLVRERYLIVNPLPGISEKDLTEEDRVVVKEWRTRNFHMQDCLRWIEGRRYEPEKDMKLRKEMEEFENSLPPGERRISKP